MKELAKVINTDKTYAVVSVDKKEECSRCGMCAFPKNARTLEMRAKNEVGANVGDTVVIEKQADAKLGGVFMAFLIPLLLIGVSIAINYLFINKEIWIVILSVIFLVLWYTILAVIDKKLAYKDRFLAVIVEIKEKNDGTNNGNNRESGV